MTNNKEERTLQFWYTKGHANHHMVIHDIKQQAVFTGDNFGISYSPLYQRLYQLEHHTLPYDVHETLLFPSSTPIDFDVIEAKKSLNIIANCQAKVVYLAHVDKWTNIDKGIQQMNQHLDTYQDFMTRIDQLLSAEESICLDQLTKQVQQWFKDFFSCIFMKKGFIF